MERRVCINANMVVKGDDEMEILLNNILANALMILSVNVKRVGNKTAENKLWKKKKKKKKKSKRKKKELRKGGIILKRRHRENKINEVK